MSISSSFANKVISSSAVNFLTNPKAGAGATTIAKVSSIAKDAVACYYYVTQTLDNDKIPEEKRKFVAALDLSNGILNVALQLVVGSITEKYAKKCFDNHLANRFFNLSQTAKLKEKVAKMTPEELAKPEGIRAIQELEAAKELKKVARQPYGNVETSYNELMSKNLFHHLSDDQLEQKLIKNKINKNELTQVYQSILGDEGLTTKFGEKVSSYEKFEEILKNTKAINAEQKLENALHFSADEIKGIAKNAKTIQLFKDIPFETFLKRFGQNRDFAKTGFTVITTLVAMQVLTKRIIVPLIATPMASFFKKHMDKNKPQCSTENAPISQKSDIKFQNKVKLNNMVFDKFEKN